MSGQTNHPYKFGYPIERENREALDANGMDPREMVAKVKANGPPTMNVDTDPFLLLDTLNQANQGACQGHSLALIFTICYYLFTGRILYFSRAAAYYLSQKFDGLLGRDVGSTLSGGQKVATEHGLCTEEDWPYPRNYNPRQPGGIKFPFKLVSSKSTNDYDLIVEALNMGLPVQTGLAWGPECEQTVVTRYTGRGAGGGHSTTLWLKKGNNFRQLNSWGESWNQDGQNEITPEAMRQMVEYSSRVFGKNVFVIYAPEGMIFPELEPVTL